METGTSTMKGFKKDGKFRPTEKRFKPSLKKEDVRSFEDSHAENISRQLASRKLLLQHKETLDMHECTLCDMQFDKNDSLYDVRVSRHIQGMHSKDRTIFSERTGSPSKPMGNHTYGNAKFVPVKEKRKDESIDDVSSDLTDDDKEKIKRMVGTNKEEEKHTGETITQEGDVKEIKRYVAFNPSSSDSLEWWTADSLEDLVWNLRHINEVSGTLQKRYDVDGRYHFADLDVIDTTKHPKLLQEMKDNWQS